MCPDGVRPRWPDEPAEGAAGGRALWRFRGRSVGARRPTPGGNVDLIHPHTASDVSGAMRAASADGTRLRVIGGREHLGAAPDVDAEVWTTLLDRAIAYDPAEMLCVVEAGMRLAHPSDTRRAGGAG